MRGAKAKKIRQQVYGDMADQRKYYKSAKTGQIICKGLRAAYQVAKRIK